MEETRHLELNSYCFLRQLSKDSTIFSLLTKVLHCSFFHAMLILVFVMLFNNVYVWMMNFTEAFLTSQILLRYLKIAIQNFDSYGHLWECYITGRPRWTENLHYRKLANWSLTRIESWIEYSPVLIQRHFNRVLIWIYFLT